MTFLRQCLQELRSLEFENNGRSQVAFLTVIPSIGANHFASSPQDRADQRVVSSVAHCQNISYPDQTAVAVEHQTAVCLELANVVTERATEVGDAITDTVSMMDLISDSRRGIGDVVSVIASVAFQSNIQSLNACPIAARARTQSCGFSAMARKMHSLLGHSAAASEIKGLFDDSIEKVGSGSRLVTDAAQSMTEVVSQVKRVNDLMAEITAASQE